MKRSSMIGLVETAISISDKATAKMAEANDYVSKALFKIMPELGKVEFELSKYWLARLDEIRNSGDKVEDREKKLMVQALDAGSRMVNYRGLDGMETEQWGIVKKVEYTKSKGIMVTILNIESGEEDEVDPSAVYDILGVLRFVEDYALLPDKEAVAEHNATVESNRRLIRAREDEGEMISRS